MSLLKCSFSVSALILVTGFFSSINVLAQQATFYEGFESADEGELPEGWTAYQNGGGGNALQYWAAWKFEGNGVEKYALSGEENGREDMIDEDWLISPQITPQESDHLIFLTRISFFPTGDMFYILASTTTGEPEAFTDTVAVYDESQLPTEFDGLGSKIRVDLSAYADMPIHLAFVHTANVGEESVSGIWLIDEVEVRPIQPAYIEEVFFRQVTSPPRPPVMVNDKLIIACDISFVLKGDYGNTKITSMTFGTTGTTDLSLIKKVRLYYTPMEYVSDYDIINELIPRLGSADEIGETLTITGDLDLELGSPHYFWMVVDLDSTRQLSFPYPQLDFTFEQYVANNEVYVPEVKSFFGALDVVSDHLTNDNLADAAEITTTGVYGSSTMPASYEEAFDKLAYCQNEGFETVHSVWWHFTPQANGWIDVDLSNSKFNSLLVFFDGDLNQLACNDNISNSKYQSAISDFPVKKGSKIFIRVSDLGSYETDESQYMAAGVVDLDFTFTVPVGVEEKNTDDISMLHPSPAKSQTSFDVVLAKPGNVDYTVVDINSGLVASDNRYLSSTGKHTITIDLSYLQTGIYLVNITADRRKVTRKLIVIH